MSGLEILGGLLIAVVPVTISEWFQDRRDRREQKCMNDQMAELSERVQKLEHTQNEQDLNIAGLRGTSNLQAERITQLGLEQNVTRQRVNHIDDMSLPTLIDRVHKLEQLPSRRGQTSDGRSDLIKGRRDS